MPSLLDLDQPASQGGGLLGLDAPRIQPPDDSGTDQGAALTQTAQMLSDYIARQRAQSTQMRLWDDTTGMPTQAGALNAARQAANALLMGTTAPGFRAYHGSPADFERFDLSKVHPDEAGHYFATDEAMARDYAGRSAADPTAGHMYEVNIKADPSQFLDYGSLSAPQQAALNDPGAVQRLRDAGVPGITLPDRTHVVFDDATIDILRKYGIAGLIGGGAAAAGTTPSRDQ